MLNLSILTVSDPWVIFYCALIFGLAAVMSGLSGFGFSAIGSLSFIFLPNIMGLSLLMSLSIITQANSFGALWMEMKNNGSSFKTGFLPYIIGGVFGLPIGLFIMLSIDSKILMISFGFILVVYSIYSLSNNPKQMTQLIDDKSFKISAVLVGFAGGILGGFSAFPASALVVWTGLKNFSKEKSRALIQPFVFFMQIIGIIMLATARPEYFGAEFRLMFALMLPAAVIGSFFGVFIYKKTTQISYRIITFIGLGLSGFVLITNASIS